MAVLLGFSVPQTLTDDAGNSLKGVTVAVTGPNAYIGAATSDAVSGALRLGALPIGDYTITYQGRSVVVPVEAVAADIQAAFNGALTPGPTGPAGLTGPAGPPGVAAELTRYYGHGVPGTIIGSKPGDEYLDVDSGNLYTLT